jgi:hypothetical protein
MLGIHTVVAGVVSLAHLDSAAAKGMDLKAPVRIWPQNATSNGEDTGHEAKLFGQNVRTGF